MMKQFIQQTFLPHLIARIGKSLLRLLCLTCRFEVQGLENFHAAANGKPCIIALWHNRLVITSEILERFGALFNYAIFVSKSRDGKILSIIADSYPEARSILVPHNARAQALKEAVRALKRKNTILLWTPDGPRGPRYQAKAGIIFAAKEASASIVPMTWASSAFWQLKTWDQMLIPKPFSKISVYFGPACRYKDAADDNPERLSHTMLAADTIACTMAGCRPK